MTVGRLSKLDPWQLDALVN